MSIVQRFKAPTPKMWRQLGNSLLAVSAAISGYTVYADEQVIALITMICGVVGKFLTNFFVEDNIAE
jgi:hypothetical protein